MLSRGRGIKLFNSIDKIIDHIINKDNIYMIQKYIEKPLLIMNKKVLSNNLSLI